MDVHCLLVEALCIASLSYYTENVPLAIQPPVVNNDIPLIRARSDRACDAPSIEFVTVIRADNEA